MAVFTRFQEDRFHSHAPGLHDGNRERPLPRRALVAVREDMVSYPPIGAHSADRAHIALRIPCQMLIQFRAQRLGQPQIHLHKTNTLAVIVTLRLVQIRI